MKHLRILIALVSLAGSIAIAGPQNGVSIYGIHLYFNETEFIDEMTLEKTDTGIVSGTMRVPNDFDGRLENLKLDHQNLSFDLLVPKNSSRPLDLVFHYEGQFFDSTQKQVIGYVTLKNDSAFIASFVGFLRY